MSAIYREPAYLLTALGASTTTPITFASSGTFPDMTIKINNVNEVFMGGELIELKDSKSYTVSSFNSTIPAGQKKITEIISGEKVRLNGRWRKLEMRFTLYQ